MYENPTLGIGFYASCVLNLLCTLEKYLGKSDGVRKIVHSFTSFYLIIMPTSLVTEKRNSKMHFVECILLINKWIIF